MNLRLPIALALAALSALAATAAAAPRANQPPSVSLTAPSNGASFATGTDVRLAASASDPDGSIARVEFYRGASTLIGTATAVPYAFTWATVPAGTHSLTAKAFDNKGASATSAAVTITVTSNRPPTVTVTSPPAAAGFLLGSTVTLAADAGDADGAVARVEYFAGERYLGASSAPPYSLQWIADTAGPHRLTARAVDAQGAATTSGPVNIRVLEPPRVVIGHPSDCTALDAPGYAELVVEAASSGSAIATVEILREGVPLGLAASANGRNFTYAWRDVPAGEHSLTARAVDRYGFSAESRPLTLFVRPPNVPPAVAITAPAAGAVFPVGSSIVLNATASDFDGILRVEYFANGVPLGGAVSPPYAVTWSGAPAGSYSLTAKAVDQTGLSAFSATVAVAIRANAPPQVALVAPAGGARFLAGSPITLAATASDGDGSIAGVEFYDSAARIGAVAAPPFTLTWVGATPGTHSLTAVAIDDLGASASSAPLEVNVDAFAVTIGSVLGGTGLYADRALVSGTAQAPAGSAVTVNGVVAAVAGDGGFHAEVPLVPGANAIVARVETHAGDTVSATASIAYDGAAPAVRVAASPLSGLAPLTVAVSVENGQDAPVSVQIDTSPVTLLAPGDTARFEASYPVAGTYFLEVRITDSASAVQTRRFAIVARGYAEVDAELRGAYDGLLRALRSGDAATALRFVTEPARAGFQVMLAELGPDLPSITEQLGTLESGPIGDDVAEYTLVRQAGSVRALYFVYFLRDGDGLWRIEGM
jgi:hypothetical protein